MVIIHISVNLALNFIENETVFVREIHAGPFKILLLHNLNSASSWC